MSIIAPESCPYLDRVRPNDQLMPLPDSAFHLPRMVDKRPWLAHAFTELLRIQRVGRLEPGIGDFRITDDTLNMTGRVLGSVRYRFLPNPSVSPLSGGGLQITWRNGVEAVEVSVFPGEGVGLARLIEDMPIEAKELEAGEYSQVNEFLAELIGCTK
jgi:hypothetical protein